MIMFLHSLGEDLVGYAWICNSVDEGKAIPGADSGQN